MTDREDIETRFLHKTRSRKIPYDMYAPLTFRLELKMPSWSGTAIFKNLEVWFAPTVGLMCTRVTYMLARKFHKQCQLSLCSEMGYGTHTCKRHASDLPYVAAC